MAVFDTTAVAAWIADILSSPGVNPRWQYILEALETLLTTGGTLEDDSVEAAQIADGVIDSSKMATDAEAITDSVDVAADIVFTAITTTQACAGALADAVRTGQLKIIKCVVYAVGSYVLTPTNFADGSTITFDTVDDVIILAFDGTTWRTVINSGTTIA